VCEEIRSLRGAAAGTGLREVVAAADEAGVCGGSVVVRELWRDMSMLASLSLNMLEAV